MSDSAQTDITALVADVLASGRALVEFTESQGPDRPWVSGGDVHARWRESHERLEGRLRELSEQLVADEASQVAADEALTYLEADPYYFWSGYARARIARSLAHAPLDLSQRQRAHRYVLDCVDGTRHCASPELAQLAGSVADNPMRRVLRERLHSPDPSVARRALRSLSRVRHPGLTGTDVVVARELVLAAAARTLWLLPSVERLARWLWTPEWEAELRDLTQHHGPERAPAKKLIESMDRRRLRRPGP